MVSPVSQLPYDCEKTLVEPFAGESKVDTLN
jgi:hypothetical protein